MKTSIITTLLLLSASLSGALEASRKSLENVRKVRRKDACGEEALLGNNFWCCNACSISTCLYNTTHHNILQHVSSVIYVKQETSVAGGPEFNRVLKGMGMGSKKAGKKVDRCVDQEMANYEAAIYALYENNDENTVSEGLGWYRTMLAYMDSETMEELSSSMTFDGVYYPMGDSIWGEMEGVMQAYADGPDALMDLLQGPGSGRRLALGCAWYTAIACVALITAATLTCSLVTVATQGSSGPACINAALGAGSQCSSCVGI
jgi:hypothetical protein